MFNCFKIKLVILRFWDGEGSIFGKVNFLILFLIYLFYLFQGFFMFFYIFFYIFFLDFLFLEIFF